MENEKYIIQICFKSLQELESFEIKLKQFNEGNNIKPIAKIEQRGSKTKLMHQKVKNYLKDHPNEKYKDVLKKVKNI